MKKSVTVNITDFYGFSMSLFDLPFS